MNDYIAQLLIVAVIGVLSVYGYSTWVKYKKHQKRRGAR
jgi:hypothetical protein